MKGTKAGFSFFLSFFKFYFLLLVGLLYRVCLLESQKQNKTKKKNKTKQNKKKQKQKQKKTLYNPTFNGVNIKVIMC